MNYSEIRSQARRNLEGYWTICAEIWLVLFVICFVIAGSDRLIFRSGVPNLISLLIWGPFCLAFAGIFLGIMRKEPVNVKDMFSGFKQFSRALVAYILMTVFVFLWTLLLIVPGIIAALSYSMTWFIMSEDPDIKPLDAINKSKQMMMGHKADLFWLYLSFIGWYLLSILSLGIGFLWLMSYIYTARSIFYLKLKGEEPAAEATVTDYQIEDNQQL